jgi:PRTRC genetic system protein E
LSCREKTEFEIFKKWARPIGKIVLSILNRTHIFKEKPMNFFETLVPLLAERNINILLSRTKGGEISAFVQPVKLTESETDAYATSFHCAGTPAQLDAELPVILARWIETRGVTTRSLTEALAIAEAEVKAAADKAKEKASSKKILPSAKSKVVAAPSLLDSPTPQAAPVSEQNSAPEIPAVATQPETPETASLVAEPASISLFD